MSVKSLMAALRAEMAAESLFPLPLRAFYGRDPDREDARTRMLNMAARHFRPAVMGDPEDAPPGCGGNVPEYRMLDPRTSKAWVNVRAAPLEFMVDRKLLAARKDAEALIGARYRAAMETRELYEAAAISPLNSIDWLRVSGGGTGSFSPTHHLIDATKKITRISKEIAKQEERVLAERGGLLDLYIGVVVGDEWAWQGLAKNARAATLSRLRLAMDSAAVALGIMPRDEMAKIWPTLANEKRPVRKRALRSSSGSPSPRQGAGGTRATKA
jgi:hypothetical protein